MKSAVVLAVGLSATLATPARAQVEPVRVPPARVGDAWTIDAAGLPFSLRAARIATAVDRFGRERDALLVEVDGPHPITSELKSVTSHTIAVDAASTVSIADVVAWEFAEGSEPGAYGSFEPNNPDGWPGWILSGGLLAGRELVPGENVEVPLVMTSTRGVERLVLSIDEAPAGPWGRCVHASGRVHYPAWVTWNGEYQHRTLDLELTTVVCDGVAYAISTDLAFSFDGGGWSAHVDLVEATAGDGAAAVAGPYEEPEGHVLAARTAFDGALPDGGPLPIWSLEGAQDAASLAPGLLAWRLLHPDGYLVEAHYLPASAVTAEEWRLVYAAPGGAQHVVLAQRRAGVATAVDLPQTESYGFPVPALSAWPDAVLTPADALAVWRQQAGPAAELIGLGWEPLVNQRWHVIARLDASCGDGCAATVDVQMAYRYDSGAAETGEYPLP